MTTYSVGIDPGLGEAGIVLRRDSDGWVLEWALTSDRLGTHYPAAFRVQAVAARLAEHLQNWVIAHDIDDLAVGLEMPIYNRNATAYAKQYATIQAIEAMLISVVAPMVSKLRIAEPHPSESKHLATGSGGAPKAEVYRKSPFPKMLSDAALPEHSLETLGDAWSHSLCARVEGLRAFDAKMMPWPVPRPAGGIA